MKPHILIVDDELSIIKLLRANLESEGYKVSAAMNGTDALNLFELEPPDVVILDITMPKMNGFQVLERIREWSHTPIIMLSARGMEDDKVKSLDLGADDYITKPFGKNELFARIRAVIRRSKENFAVTDQPSISGDDLQINFNQRRVTVAERDIRLTPTEYNLLLELAQNEGKVLTHAHLLNKIWGPEYLDDKEYLHVFISRLRNKIETEPARPRHVLNVSGIGYQFSR